MKMGRGDLAEKYSMTKWQQQSISSGAGYFQAWSALQLLSLDTHESDPGPEAWSFWS